MDCGGGERVRGNNAAWSVAFTYLGAVIGAGFASGQEILRFFGVFGYRGILGTLAAGVLFAVLGALIIRTAYSQGMKNYEDFIIYVFGSRWGRYFDGLIFLFLLAGLAVMLIACGGVVNQLWGLPNWCGFFLAALITAAVLLNGVEGILWFNTLLVPGLLLFSAGVSFLGIMRSDFLIQSGLPVSALVGKNWFVAAVLYVAYNLILSITVLTALGDAAPRGGVRGALAGGLSLGSLAALMCLALIYNKAATGEVPMLRLASSLHPLLGWMYSFVLLAAILTTALCDGWGLLNRLAKLLPWPPPFLLLLIFMPTLPFLGWRLAQAVGIIYPLLGYLGLLVLAAILGKKIPRLLCFLCQGLRRRH